MYSRDVEHGKVSGQYGRAMNLSPIALSKFATFAVFLAIPLCAPAEPCPKVSTTTQTPATMRAIVKSINCLVDSGSAPAVAQVSYRGSDSPGLVGTQVDTVPVIGPQHTRTYPGFMLAILSMPVDSAQRSALVTADSPQAVVRGSGAGECKLKLNSDHTVDAQCTQAGGTVFVVYK